MKKSYMLFAAGILVFALFPLSAQEQEGGDSSVISSQTAEAVDETTLAINTGENNDDLTGDVSASAIGLSDLIRTILVLLLVIGAIYLVLYMLRRFSTSSIDGSSLIKVVGSKGLMKDSAVHLLEVGNQVFLVGTGNSSVNLISEITDRETIDNIRLNLSGESEETKTFAQRIASNLGLGKSKNAEEQIKNAESFLRSQRGRLKDL